jgi:hypothetical protein
LEFGSVISSLRLQDASVKFLSMSQLFLLCTMRCFCAAALEPRLCVLVVLQCFATPQNTKRIVGRRLGLPGFYRGGALIATEAFTGEIVPSWLAEENLMVRMIVVVACSSAVLIGSAAAQEKQVTDDQYAELQKNFAEAYNRKDADAMAAAFAEDGIRVTPSGIFQGHPP